MTLKIDLVSIFPSYFAPLELSLPGKAQQAGLVYITSHDLRAWTDDRHRTVDDTPYGGGAGMVMKAEPWARALDDICTETSTVVFTTPAGELFSQATAKSWSSLDHLVIACGRYEGFDQRVIEYSATRWLTREISIGEFVLNGGEVAALAMVEAVIRLIPGFMGNADSLAEESHNEVGLLEYPTYTKPALWRDRAVPPVLLSGNHAEIRRWRQEQSQYRSQLR